MKRAIFIIVIAISFYIFDFVIQVIPSVMTHTLMEAFNLNSAGVGTLSAFFYYAYSPMQFPGGLLYDRFGPRLVMTAAVFVATLGVVLFYKCNSYPLVALGRFLMGFGAAFSNVGILVLAARWFLPKYFSIINGLAQSCAAIAAITSEVFLSYLIKQTGWRETLFYISIIGLILTVIFWLYIRNYPKGATKVKKQNKSSLMKSLKDVLGSGQSWLIGFYAFFIWLPLTAFAALWGVPYLSKAYSVSIRQGAEILSLFWIGVAVASPLLGWWSEFSQQRRLPLTLCAVVGGLASLVMLYVHLPIFIMLVIIFLMGAGVSGQALCFAVVRDNNNKSHMGAAVGLNNFMVVLSGAIGQPLLGYLIDYDVSSVSSGAKVSYTLHNYQFALQILPVCYFMAAIFAWWFIKETYCLPFRRGQRKQRV